MDLENCEKVNTKKVGACECCAAAGARQEVEIYISHEFASLRRFQKTSSLIAISRSQKAPLRDVCVGPRVVCE